MIRPLFHLKSYWFPTAGHLNSAVCAVAAPETPNATSKSTSSDRMLTLRQAHADGPAQNAQAVGQAAFGGGESYGRCGPETGERSGRPVTRRARRRAAPSPAGSVGADAPWIAARGKGSTCCRCWSPLKPIIQGAVAGSPPSRPHPASACAGRRPGLRRPCPRRRPRAGHVPLSWRTRQRCS